MKNLRFEVFGIELQGLRKKKMMKSQQQASHYWLFDSRSNSRRSPWLQSTLAGTLSALVSCSSSSFLGVFSCYCTKGL